MFCGLPRKFSNLRLCHHNVSSWKPELDLAPTISGLVDFDAGYVVDYP